MLAAGASGLAAAPARAIEPVRSAATRLGTALVLSGGGARGAYEAGVIGGLVRRAGISDGEPLPDVDCVVGTSIGAINGYFVATAQYSRLRDAWATISSSELFRPKRRYAALETPSAGVVTRMMEGLSLLANLNRSMDGIFDAEPIKAWLRANVDAARQPIVPFVFNAADIRNMQAAYFYLVDPDADDPDTSRYVLGALAGVSGMRAVAQSARPILHDALYASVALPMLLDPIELVIDGVPGLFVDGGSADNTAIDVARVIARRITAVFVEPQQSTSMPENAIAAGLGSFSLLQERVLDASMRGAYTSTQVKRLFSSASLGDSQRAFIDAVDDVDLRILRPSVDLPSGIGDFHDAATLATSYQLGLDDAANGWTPYEPPQYA
jgi:NTE family protein